MGNVCKSACMDFLCFLFGPAPTTTQSLSDYIKEEINKLQGTNVDVTQLTPLVEFIGNQLSRIKAALPSPATASTSRSRMAGYVKDMTKPESVHSGIVFASKIIGRISEEVEELENTETGRVAVSAVNVIGQSRHWALLGLSMVAYVLEGIETVSSNVSECVELLERMVELEKTLQTLESALSHEAHREPLNRAVETIVEGATFCCVYIAKGKDSRGVVDIAKGISHHEKESPQKFLDIVPVGINDRVETVKEFLEMEGSKSAVANIVDKEYMQKLLPRDLSVGEKKLRMLVASRDINVRQEVNVPSKEHLVQPHSEQTSVKLLRNTILQGQLEETIRVHINQNEKMIRDIDHVRDVNMFPFKDASQLPKLKVFHNESEHGMDLTKLPQTLKQLKLTVPPAYETSAVLPIRWTNMSSLRNLQKFELRTSKLVEFPEAFVLPAFIEGLDISKCKELPEGFACLTSMRKLKLEGCTELTALPEELGSFRSLMSLSMNGCIKLTALPKRFGGLTSLNDLSLTQCKSLEGLPEYFSKLSSLESLKIDGYESLKALSELSSSLRFLNLDGCFKLASLPESFGSLRKLERLNLSGLMESLPEDFGNLCNLKELFLQTCALSKINGLGRLHSLEKLEIWHCERLSELPTNLEQLSCLKRMVVSYCSGLKELPERFHQLPLRELHLLKCSSLVSLPKRFGGLRCLEWLSLQSCLSLPTLPDGFGNLTSLKHLDLESCCNLRTLPYGCLNVLVLHDCRILEGEAMDRLVTVECLCSLQILRSNKLEERWEEMQKEEKEYPLVVRTSKEGQIIEKMVLFEKYQSAAGVAFFHGRCLMVDRVEQYSSSRGIEPETKVALLIGQYNQVQRMRGVLQPALERLLPDSMMIVYIDVDYDDDDDHHNNALQILELLYDGSRASIDLRTRFLFRKAFYRDECTALVIAYVIKDDKGYKHLGEFNNISVDFLRILRIWVWIPSRRSDDFGASINNVHEKRMSVLTLLDPVLLGSFSKNSDKVIVFNKEGSISCRDASMWMMIWGPKFYPFTLKRLNELLSRESLNMERKSSFEFLIGQRISFLDSSGAKVSKESLRGKVVMLYGGYPDTDFNSKLISVYEKLKYRMGLHNFEIVFVGIYKTLLLYEAFPHNIPCLSLSVYGMTTFWYRREPHCISGLGINLSENSAQIRKFGRLVKHVMTPEHGESGWVVVFDGNGEVVTLRGKEVVELLWKSDGNSEEEMVREAMIESIKNGNCSKIKIRFGDQEEAEVTETVHRLPKRIRPKANSRAMEQNKNKIRR
eukprot:Gb_01034 [translate_table: standard]